MNARVHGCARVRGCTGAGVHPHRFLGTLGTIASTNILRFTHARAHTHFKSVLSSHVSACTRVPPPPLLSLSRARSLSYIDAATGIYYRASCNGMESKQLSSASMTWVTHHGLVRQIAEDLIIGLDIMVQQKYVGIKIEKQSLDSRLLLLATHGDRSHAGVYVVVDMQ